MVLMLSRQSGGGTLALALSCSFEALCEANSVAGNSVDGVKRPKLDSQEGITRAIGDH